MKFFLVLILCAYADLIGFNRQQGIAESSGKAQGWRVLQENLDFELIVFYQVLSLTKVYSMENTHQDQIIIHLAKNGQYELLRKFLKAVRFGFYTNLQIKSLGT